jgi:quercetin dioxygenase-like cupin family protein
MDVTKIADAKKYEAARHWDVSTLRLQGLEASPTKKVTVGLSYFLPGGGAEKSSSPLERVYVVVDGEVAVTVGGKETVLGPLDSCHIPAGEERAIVNKTNRVATMLVVMPPPEK